MIRPTIGIFPSSALRERTRLFAALAEAYPVVFVARDDDSGTGLSAAICVGSESLPAERIAADNIPCLVVPAEQSSVRRNNVRLVKTSRAGELDARLRGHEFREECAAEPVPIPAENEDRILATSGERPVWLRRRFRATTVDRSAFPLDELSADECLRDRLRDGRCWSLLPALCFIRNLIQDEAFAGPAPRACFLIDDPNLRSPRYGFIDYRRLAISAAEHGYHVSFATIPADLHLADRRIVRLFLERRAQLSLIAHGNNHLRCELDSEDETVLVPLLAQALRRARAFVKATGLEVAPIMAAPHGACSRAALEIMRLLGYEAACISRPYPWLKKPPRDVPLAGWQAGEWVGNGTVVLPRCRISTSAAELALRAYLNQPLILYGHHTDLAGGYEYLEEIAARLGEVRWMSVADIARSNYAIQRRDGTRRVRLYGRGAWIAENETSDRLIVEVPALTSGLDRIKLQIFRLDATRPDSLLETDCMELKRGADRMYVGEVPVSGSSIGIRIIEPAAIDPALTPDPPWRVWPILRRRLTEARDRSLPYRKRLLPAR